MVFFAKGATSGAWYGQRGGWTVVNSIVPLPHFVRWGTKIVYPLLQGRHFQWLVYYNMHVMTPYNFTLNSFDICNGIQRGYHIRITGLPLRPRKINCLFIVLAPVRFSQFSGKTKKKQGGFKNGTFAFFGCFFLRPRASDFQKFLTINRQFILRGPKSDVLGQLVCFQDFRHCRKILQYHSLEWTITEE